MTRGLEQWQPVLKAEFPLSRGGRSRRWPARSAWTRVDAARTLDELVARAGPAGRPGAQEPRATHRRRLHGRALRLRTEHGSTQTIAVESEDPDAVLAAVEELGLGGRTNTCVARGLKALAGFGRASR